MVDIIKEIVKMDKNLFDILLKDRSTKRNICWATDNYIRFGSHYYPQEPITQGLVTGVNATVVQPRAIKSIEERTKRTKEKAEVFTPSWVCNEQNNLIDETWFGKKNIFNITSVNSWTSTKGIIEFPTNKSWKAYVDDKRLEISCGEAPYLVSRYDSVSGNQIPIEERIGLLDRKLRIVNENTTAEEEWLKWATRAYESTYGYEYQGDNILIARENLLYTFIENMQYKFSHKPNDEQMKKIARIISWNIWQMDGITMTAPFSERPRAYVQMTLFGYEDDIQYEEKEPIPCRIYDWRSNNSLEFKSMLKGGSNNGS